MKRAIQDKVEDFLSEEVFLSNIKENVKYTVKVQDEVVVIQKGK